MYLLFNFFLFFFFQAEDGIRDVAVTGVQTCALPILLTLAQRRLKVARLAGEIDERILLLERHIAGARQRRALAAPGLEMLLDTDAVDRQLQRARRLRRPAELVVDDPEREIGRAHV